jgi:hypothetical protein
MSLARTWTRQLYGASGIALLAPATLMAAVAVIALNGGFAALGAIGQAFSGPSVTPALRLEAGPAGTSSPLVPVLQAGPAGLLAGVGGAARTPGAGRSTGGAGNSTSQNASRPGGAPGAPGAGGTNGPGGSPGPPPSPPAQTPVDRVIGAVTGVTDRIPGPVGTIGTQTLQSVGKTLDGILSSPGHVRRP